MWICRDGKIQDLNTTDVNMQRRGKQSKVYRIGILWMPICIDKENKVKSTEVKCCRCQYAHTKKAK